MEELSDRDAAILIIRRELRRRSGKAWSVTGGRGTAWGWITVTAPPARRDQYGGMVLEDRQELARLLNLTPLDYVDGSGVSIPASSDHRIEFVDRARGLTPAACAEPYWD